MFLFFGFGFWVLLLKGWLQRVVVQKCLLVCTIDHNGEFYHIERTAIMSQVQCPKQITLRAKSKIRFSPHRHSTNFCAVPKGLLLQVSTGNVRDDLEYEESFKK